MKKLILIVALLVASIQAAETSIDQNPALPLHYNYVKLSDQWLLFPGLGIGSRFHNKHNGFDVDLTAYSYWDAGWSLYGKGHYLYYPTEEHFYLGMGAGIIGGCFSASFVGTPLIHGKLGNGFFIKPTIEAILGYEWTIGTRPFFLQLEVAGSYGHIPLYPALSCGIGF